MRCASGRCCDAICRTSDALGRTDLATRGVAIGRKTVLWDGRSTAKRKLG